MSKRINEWAERLYGPRPSKGSPTLVGLRYVRRIYVRMLPFAIPGWAVLALIGAQWSLALLVVSLATWLFGIAAVSLRISRLAKDSPP